MEKNKKKDSNKKTTSIKKKTPENKKGVNKKVSTKKTVKKRLTKKEIEAEIKKNKKRKIFLYIIISILSIILIISVVNIILWFKDSKETKKTIKKLKEKVEITEVEDSENTEVVEEEFNPYWDYRDTKLMDVNFSELKSINEDVVGWIQVAGTNINYPFVQTGDNSFYLNHSFYKNNNKAGWVFLDYRNNISDLNRNNIIYAHARLDNTMFGELRKILSTKWINNPDNYIIRLSTESQNTVWQIFSIYKIPTTNDYIRVNFSDDDSFSLFANMLLNRSEFNFNTGISGSDKILTLSTCYDEHTKTVVHAKLIKIEYK